MGLTDRVVRGLTSRRVTEIEQPKQRPFGAPLGGWFVPTEDLPDDPIMAERSARANGAALIAQLQRERVGERRAAMDSRLGAAPRGHDFSRGLHFREGS